MHQTGDRRKLVARTTFVGPDKYHEILVMREIEGLSYEEIAKRLGMSKGTVESRLFRARERLRERLASWMEA